MLSLNNKHNSNNKPFNIDKKGNIIREQKEEILFEVNVKPKKGEKYKDFFKRAMKEYGIDKIEKMSKKEKDKFFTDIERTWTKEDPETDDKDVRDE